MIWQIFWGVIIVLVIAYLAFTKRMPNLSSSGFFITLLGVILGLSVGALVSIPLSRLADPFGRWLPIAVDVFTVAVVTTFFYNQRDMINKSFGQIVALISGLVKESRHLRRDIPGGEQANLPSIVIDTSVIIDGRILDLVKTYFVSGKLIIPQFVLNELQGIADSEDTLRRNKGRRGLEILNDLKRQSAVEVVVAEDDFENENDVDSKIIKLAKRYKSKLMTVDYNLNRVARIQNVDVLNVNELSNALRPVLLPGEILKIKIIQAGKDEGQGVGYLEDGTMVVVEDGGKWIGQEKEVVVTRVFQTVAGKMIFAMPESKYRQVHQ